MNWKVIILASYLTLVGSCRSKSETECINPNSNDPACKMDSRRDNPANNLGALQVATDADLPECTSNLEGRLFYVSGTQTFKICSGGIHVTIDLKGEKGDPGDPGDRGPGGQTQSVSGTVEAGESLTLTHNLNTMNPPVVAHFVRGGYLRDVSKYEKEVGLKSVLISGDERDNLEPVMAQFASGSIGIVRDALGPAGTAEFLVANDEGVFAAKEALQLSNAKGNVRAVMTTSGFLLASLNTSTNDLNIRVIAENKTLVVNKTDLTSVGDVEGYFDAKVLSNGNVAIVYKRSGTNDIWLTVVDASNGSVVVAASSIGLVASSEKLYIGSGNGTIAVIYEKSTDNHMYAQLRNNDGTSNVAETLVMNNANPLGIAAVGNNYAIIYQDDADSKAYTKLLSGSFAQVTSASIVGGTSSTNGGAFPLVLNNNQYVVASLYHEVECQIFDSNGVLQYISPKILSDGDTGSRPSAIKIGNGNRFALLTEIDYSDDTVNLDFFSHREGRLEFEIVDANTVRVNNKSSESLPILIAVLK